MKTTHYEQLGIVTLFDEKEKLVYIKHREDQIVLSFEDADLLIRGIQNDITKIRLDEYKKDFKYEGSSL